MIVDPNSVYIYEPFQLKTGKGYEIAVTTSIEKGIEQIRQWSQTGQRPDIISLAHFPTRNEINQSSKIPGLCQSMTALIDAIPPGTPQPNLFVHGRYERTNHPDAVKISNLLENQNISANVQSCNFSELDKFCGKRGIGSIYSPTTRSLEPCVAERSTHTQNFKETAERVLAAKGISLESDHGVA